MKITTLFFDIGGVILTNGWDHNARKRAAEHFSINYDEFNEKHESVFIQFEKGQLSLDEYLNHTIFFKERNFLRSDFIEFMKTQSKPYDGSIKVLEKLSEEKRYLLASINNESLELNHFRIKKFKLTNYFQAFFSSGFLNKRKPDVEIFQTALNVLQKNPEECFFIDDREENIDGAKKAGLNTIHLKEINKLYDLLENNGIKIKEN